MCPIALPCFYFKAAKTLFKKAIIILDTIIKKIYFYSFITFLNMKIYYFKRKQRLSTFLFVEIILQSGSQRPHFDSQEAFKEFP